DEIGDTIMQELHTAPNDSMEGDLPDPLYDLKVNTDGGKFNVILPGELMDAQGFYHQMPVSFEPRINADPHTGEAEVSFRICRIDHYDVDPEYLPDQEPEDGDEDEDASGAPVVPFGNRNEMRMWSMYRAGRLSFPLEYVKSLTIDQAA